MNEQMKMALHNEVLEREVLGCMMTYNGLVVKHSEVLSGQLFYFPKHRALFKAIKDVSDNGDFPDILNVGMYLMQHPDPLAPEAWEIADMSTCTHSSVDFGRDVEALQDLAKRRRYWVLGQKLISYGTDMTMNTDEIDKDLDKIREENLIASKDVYDMSAINQALTERISNNLKDERATMIPTGFSYIDERGGFQLTDFNVIAASTSQGKTTLAVNILYHAALKGIPGMFFSLEMTIEQLAARINAPLSGVSSGLMLFKKLRTDQIREFERAKAMTDKLSIYVDDNTTNFEKIKDSIRYNAIKRRVKIFFIDYLQVLSSTNKRQESEAQFYETISRELKNIAKELKVCIVAMSQLNREAKDTDPRPTLSKIKASSGIEQAADTVLLIYRPGYYGKRHKYRPELDPDKSSEIIVGKGRNIGGTGSFYVGFKPELSQFYDLEVESGTEETRTPEPVQEQLPF